MAAGGGSLWVWWWGVHVVVGEGGGGFSTAADWVLPPQLCFELLSARELSTPQNPAPPRRALCQCACCQTWRSGDVRAVHDLLAPGCHTVAPIFGDKKASRQEWEEMVRDVFQVRML